MCKVQNCNWFKHWLGLCRHEEIEKLQQKVAETRKTTNEELRDFNDRLNVIIKDENISLTLTNIKKVRGDK